MYTLKRITTYLFIILLIISLYQDLTKGTLTQSTNKSSQINKLHEHQDYHVVEVTVNSGETVLSIIEQVNKGKEKQINIDKMLADFQKINPNVNPYKLTPKTDYSFPLYDK